LKLLGQKLNDLSVVQVEVLVSNLFVKECARHQKRGAKVIGFDLFGIRTGGRRLVAAERQFLVDEQLGLIGLLRM
jgi:hypothetical protein